MIIRVTFCQHHEKVELCRQEPPHGCIFRVVCRNKEGVSDPLLNDQYVIIKDPWDEPGKPGRPSVVDFDADHIDIEWDPPAKDGGSPITGVINIYG